jgi:hypothetical protein
MPEDCPWPSGKTTFTGVTAFRVAEFVPPMGKDNFMAANPNVVTDMELASEKEGVEIAKAKPVILKKRIRNLLIDIFEGHEEFLGRTPD